MVSDILQAIDINEATIYEIQFKTYISYQHLKKYLAYLVQNELITYKKDEKRFKITQRGIYAVDLYAKMDELLGRKILHNVMKTSQADSCGNSELPENVFCQNIGSQVQGEENS
jgi:predicted transcriptional regulator